MRQKQIIIFFLTILSFSGYLFAQNNTKLPPAEDFTLTDTDGNTWNLYEQLNAGKTVVLDFFSTGCGSCISAIPIMNQLWIDNGSNNGNVLFWGIEVTGADALEVDTFLNYYGGNYTAFSSVGYDTIIDLYDLTYTPTYFVVCPNKIKQLCVLDEIQDKIGYCSLLNFSDSQIEKSIQVFVYPNKQIIAIQNSNFLRIEGEFLLFDITGKLIIKQMLQLNNPVIELKIPAIKPGIYMYLLQNQNTVFTKGKMSYVK